jgi:uncharacterized repeat protein (TIGR01451 family)
VRKRPILLAAAAVAAGLAVFRTVEAQVPPSGGYLPRVAPPSAPAGGGNKPTPDWSSNPAAGLGAKQSGTAPAATGRPRLTSPVMAGPDGVRPASGELPPPDLDLSARPTDPLSPPKLATEPPANDPKLPALPTVPSIPSIPGVPTAPPVSPAPTDPPAPLPVAPTGSGSAPLVPVPPTPPGAIPTIESGGLKVPSVGAGNPPLIPTPVGGGTLRPGAPNSAAWVPNKVTQTVTLEAVCAETVVYGGEFRYELVVKNNGTGSVASVRIEDELPAGAKYVGSDPPAELNGERLAWAVGTLDAGAEKRIAVRVKPSEEGDLTSRATVTYSAVAEARTKVTRPRIAVAVTGAEVCKSGDETIFQIKVTNSGTGPAQQMVLQALLTDGLLHSQGLKLEMAIANLPAGETKTVPLRVTAGKAGIQTCQVSVAAVGSPETGAKASVNVVEPVLHVAQSGPAKCYVRGAEPVYEITLSNTGTAATDAITLYSVLPEGFDFVQSSEGGAYSAPNRAVVWKLAGLTPGTSKAFSLKMRATVAGEGTLRTVAQAVPEQPVQGAGGAVKPAGRVVEAKAESPVKAEGVAAVRFEVIDLDDPVEAGKEAVYEIRVMNQGTGACTNVQLVATLAEGTTYTGSSGPTQVKAQGQHLVFDPIANLAVKGDAVYRVKVRGSVAGDLRFRVSLTCDQVRTPVVKEESTRFFRE